MKTFGLSESDVLRTPAVTRVSVSGKYLYVLTTAVTVIVVTTTGRTSQIIQNLE